MSTLSRSISTHVSKEQHREKVPHDEIALRAYQLYQNRGEQHGYDRDDWLEAETQLVREREAPARRSDEGRASVGSPKYRSAS